MKTPVKVLLILVSLFLQIQSEEGYCETYGAKSFCKKFTIQPGQHLELNNPHGIITELNLWDCSISSIPSEFFNEFRNVEHIHMRHVGASVIESDAFRGMKNLKRLGLNGNDIPEIQGNLFTDLVSLEELDLPFNNLIEITPDAFAGLNKLKFLDLSFNNIKTIHPESFASLINLQALNLSYNSLNGLKSGIFKTMANLKELNLADSNLFKIDNELFQGLKSLQHLNVRASAIRQLESNCFADLSELIRLDLNVNFLENISVGAFGNLHKLEELKLNHNDLISLSGGEFFGLIQLKSLFIHNNKISQLDAKNLLTQLPNLKYIKLNDNTWQCDYLKNILGVFYKRTVEILDNYTSTLTNFNGISCSHEKLEKLVLNKTLNIPKVPPPKKEENMFLHSNYDISHIVEKFEEAYERHSKRMTIINAIVLWVSMLTIIVIVAFVGVCLYRRRKLSLSRSYLVQYNEGALISDSTEN